DMRNMGGLRKHMPVTYWTMLIATLAIVGIPGFSGFFSKDEILWQAFSSSGGGMGLWLIGAVAAGLTTFYMFRLIFMTFWGKPRMDAKTAAHVHEAPKVMTVPLVILAVLSVIGGYVGIPAVFGGSNRFEHFLAPVFSGSRELVHASQSHGQAAAHHSLELFLMGIVLVVVLVGLWLAIQFYLRKTDLPALAAQKAGALYRLVFNKYYVDELYDQLICNPLRWLSDTALWKWIDIKGIDGSVNGVGTLARQSGKVLSRLQTGLVQNYALALVVGITILLLYLLL
ncbi:NADH-quinone oxidoreductase subunit L, partial [candidate division KSB1 bacterium]|nr:NADH-quinone oxidoreductase subunit L [candidate division KSB1 bacterium]